MKSLRSLQVLSQTVAFFLLAVTAVKAGPLSITLAAPFQIGPESVFAFDATVANTSNQVVFLNADSFNVDSPLTVDDSPFNAYPLSLAASGTSGDSYTGVLFNVDVPDGTPFTLYTGSFEILGGTDPLDNTDVAGSAIFDVTVTPEPSSFLLIGSALLAFKALVRRKLG